MSSLMRMKSTCWWAAIPSALRMLCRSAAMPGRVDNSAQRGLQRKKPDTQTVSATKHRHTMTTCQMLLQSAYDFALRIIPDSSFCCTEWPESDMALWQVGKLDLPTEDFEQLASMIVGVENFWFGLCCLNGHNIYIKKRSDDRFKKRKKCKHKEGKECEGRGKETRIEVRNT